MPKPPAGPSPLRAAPPKATPPTRGPHLERRPPQLPSNTITGTRPLSASSTNAQYPTYPDLTPLAAYGATLGPAPTPNATTIHNHHHRNNNINNPASPHHREDIEIDADAESDLLHSISSADPTPTATSPSTPTAAPPSTLAENNVYQQSAYNYGTWSADDDSTLIAARSRGQHWADLQRAHFPSKTANACRKRYERLMERKGVYDYDARKLERIAKEYMGMRKQIWAGLAARVGEKWPAVEAQCMSTGLKTIQSNARSYTNRWRREAKISQKTRAGEPAGGQISQPGVGMGPVTNMGLISPVEDEFGGGFLGTSEEMQATPTAESMGGLTPRANNPGMMPPPFLPVGVPASLQHGMGYHGYSAEKPPDVADGRGQTPTLMPGMSHHVPGPIDQQEWQAPGMPGAYMGHQDRPAW